MNNSVAGNFKENPNEMKYIQGEVENLNLNYSKELGFMYPTNPTLCRGGPGSTFHKYIM